MPSNFRHWMKRLEKRAERNSFELKDGTSYRYDFDEAVGDLFVYCVELWTADEASEASEPEVPPSLQAIRNARDPTEAMEPFRPQNRRGAGAFLDPILLIQDQAEGDREA